MLTNILTNTNFETITVCLLSSIVLGFIIAISHKLTSNYNKNFLITITLLPMIVASIILVVNGNLGMGIAVAGTFSLVRFRSVAGTSKEILIVFFAMAVGLTIGAGFLYLGAFITIIGSLMIIGLNKLTIFDIDACERSLKIVIPEDLDYTEVFDDILKKYTTKYSLERVKTVNLGSMFELKYLITLNKNTNEKEFIDELRIKNGNLKISLTKPNMDNEL